MTNLPLTLSLSAILIGGGFCLSAPCAAMETTTTPTAPAISMLTKSDTEFVQHALLGGMAEIKASELALKRGVAGSEREFAQKMVDEHTMVNEELKALALKKGVTVPTMLDEKMQKNLNDLSKESDADFAEAYFEGQVDAHEKAVSAFKDASEDAQDADVKTFATKHVPHLQAHLEEAMIHEKKH